MTTTFLCAAQESTSLPRKFCGLLDVPLCALGRRRRGPARACFVTPAPLLAARALRRHASQWVWFRALFIVFARCSFVNTLVQAEAA